MSTSNSGNNRGITLSTGTSKSSPKACHHSRRIQRKDGGEDSHRVTQKDKYEAQEKGQGRGQGNSKGKSKGPVDGVKYVAAGKGETPYCRNYNDRTCTTSACRFLHKCNAMLDNGGACGSTSHGRCSHDQGKHGKTQKKFE